jgi:hypothetical protein
MLNPRIVRVFPRQAKWTPDDDMAYVGDPPLFFPAADEVHVSCTFTWDKPECERLALAWNKIYRTVKLGGPAYDDPGKTFEPGMYIKKGYVITSRGCTHNCPFCLVPRREGKLRTLPIKEGYNVEDNNILACPREHQEAVFDMLSRQKDKPRFTGGLEAALMNEWFAEQCKIHKVAILYLAYDRPAQGNALIRAEKILREAGIPRGVMRCYVMVGTEGDTPEAAEERLRFVFQTGLTPFAMYYRPITDTKWYVPPKEWREVQQNWTLGRVVFARMKRLGVEENAK